MIAHAAAIAEKLQGAHERRQRGEDKDMGKDEGVWAEAARQIEQALTMVRENVEHGLPDEDAPQSNAVTAERVVELERRLADALVQREASDAAANERDGEHEELEQQRDTWRERSNRQTERTAELELLLATAYVAREVPWSDVAAGMMTIARDGTPWMVESRGYDADNEFVILRNGEKTFTKTLDPGKAETVRVLVPYVTPEQAEELVKSELGGRA